MKFRFSNWTPSLVLLSALTALATSGCGDDGTAAVTDPVGDSGTPSDNDAATNPTSGGSSTHTAAPQPSMKPPQGDAATTAAEPSNAPDTSTGPTPSTESDSSTPPTEDGGQVVPPVSGDVDDLIGAICEWEFRCCDDGERAYRFGPSIADAAACRARFVDELHASNSTKNPFVSGPAAGGLLAALAYSVNLSRVSVNSDAVSACIAEYNELGCNSPAPTVVARCTAAGAEAVNPCALDELLKPTLEQDAVCTPALGQGNGLTPANDIECVTGTSCLAADDPANGNGVPACIKRAVVDEFCSDDTDCDYGLYCNASSCQEKGSEGEACSYEDDNDTGIHPSSCKSGLSCDPDTDTCVAACTEGYECQVDSQCPDGLSCAPVFAGDEMFHVCRNLGDDSAAKCDDENDCVATQYCNLGGGSPGNCAPDRDISETCDGTPGQCAGGTYCDGDSCEAYNDPAELCVPGADPLNAPECEPASVGCLQRFGSNPDPSVDAEEDGLAFKCRSAKNDLGDDCIDAYECASDKCEVVDDQVVGHTTRTCTEGADVGDDCDSDVDNKDALTCKAGTFCDVETSKCVAQLAPGAGCENPDTDMADGTLCANGVCGDQWDSLICTDAPVPESAGGTGVTCDGNE